MSAVYPQLQFGAGRLWKVKEKEQTEQLLEEKMERWEYLEDLAAKIAGQQ